MRGVFPAKFAVFLQFQPVRACLFILACGVIPAFTFGARKGNNLLHKKSIRLLCLGQPFRRVYYGESKSPRSLGQFAKDV